MNPTIPNNTKTIRKVDIKNIIFFLLLLSFFLKLCLFKVKNTIKDTIITSKIINKKVQFCHPISKLSNKPKKKL